MPFLSRNGTRLAFDLAEGAGPPVVLIHGWCCDRTFMAEQFAHFATRGHRVLAMDLRGHGESDKPHENYSFQEFGDDVVFLCTALRFARPVLIGHSMGGIIAFDLARRLPDWPPAIAMIDAAAVLSDGARKAVAASVAQMQSTDAAANLRHLMESVFFVATDDAERRARILDTMSRAPTDLLISGAEALRDYDPSAAKGRLTAPALFIQADEPTPRSDLARMAELVPQLQIGRTVGSGHFCQLEVPEQVNAMLDRFLKLALGWN